MNRQDEINKMAKEVASYLTSDKDIQVAFADVLKRGAQWADDHPDIDVRAMAAWQSGYKAAIDAHPQWISVEDELPKDDKWVLGFTAFNAVEVMRYCNGDWWDTMANGVDPLIVTHWMPLPTPPVVSKTENAGKKGGEQ